MALSFRTSGDYVDLIDIDDTFLHAETTIKHLHNTSRCVQWSLPSDTDRITFTIDESKYEEVLIVDIDFDGVAMTEQADFQTGIQSLFIGGLSSSTVELNDAQINALPSGLIDILDAPGAGKINIPSKIVLTGNYVAGYTNIAVVNKYVAIGYEGNATAYFGTLDEGETGAFFDGNILTPGTVIFPLTALGGDNSWSVFDVATLANKKLQLEVHNDDGAFTGGNAANILKVTVYYTIVDL